MSQQILGDASAIPRNVIIAYENQIALPSMALAGELAKALDCSVDDLFNVEQVYIPVSFKVV